MACWSNGARWGSDTAPHCWLGQHRREEKGRRERQASADAPRSADRPQSPVRVPEETLLHRSIRSSVSPDSLPSADTAAGPTPGQPASVTLRSLGDLSRTPWMARSVSRGQSAMERSRRPVAEGTASMPLSVSSAHPDTSRRTRVGPTRDSIHSSASDRRWSGGEGGGRRRLYRDFRSKTTIAVAAHCPRLLTRDAWICAESNVGHAVVVAEEPQVRLAEPASTHGAVERHLNEVDRQRLEVGEAAGLRSERGREREEGAVGQADGLGAGRARGATREGP